MVRDRVVGVDGCPGGWIAVQRNRVEVVADIRSLLDRFDVIGIDIPIGMPATGVRSCDRAARRLLGGRASTVFTTSPRDVVACAGYLEANELSKRVHRKGITVQAFGLHKRMRELDAVMTPELSDRVVEIHPECSLRTLAGHPFPSKHTRFGLSMRQHTLAGVFGPLVPINPRGAERHDVLDAYAVLWSAERFARGEHTVLGDQEVDERGLIMRIVV